MNDIGRWLDDLGLGQYGEAFAAHEVDLAILPHLSEADLERIGLPLGPRKKILLAIARFDASEAAPPPSTAHESERRQITVMF